MSLKGIEMHSDGNLIQLKLRCSKRLGREVEYSMTISATLEQI